MLLGSSSPAGIRDSVAQEKGRGVAKGTLPPRLPQPRLDWRAQSNGSSLQVYTFWSLEQRSFASWRLLR